VAPVVVVAPYNVASFPEGGGHFWVYLQYAHGLKRLGCDVYWLEELRVKGPEQKVADALQRFGARMEQHGFGGRWILYRMPGASSGHDRPDYVNRDRAEAEAIFASADLLLNFHYAICEDMLARFRSTALVDIDPGLLQFWIARGQIRVLRHDLYLTIGEHVGDATASDGTGMTWHHIRPPICLEHWPYTFDADTEAFTTVSNWDSSDWVVGDTGAYENTKRVAFLEFADLPRLTAQPLELALFLRHQRDLAEQTDLERRGWRIRQSGAVAGTPEAYRRYIQTSRGEFSCAKRSYREFRNAWVSDRTLCYLASGKPVVVQHTGPSAFLPDADGMFRFSTMKEAADAFVTINADYEGQCQAARAIAETHFNATRTLAEVLTLACC
jgi:hypothetical protein